MLLDGDSDKQDESVEVTTLLLTDTLMSLNMQEVPQSLLRLLQFFKPCRFAMVHTSFRVACLLAIKAALTCDVSCMPHIGICHTLEFMYDK